MSISPPTKETILAHPPSPLSSQAHLSPRLLTPDSDSFIRKSDTLVFTKQPIPRKHLQPSFQRYSTTESEASDGHISEVPHAGGSRPHSPVKAHHVSLLTAILSSPDAGGKPIHRGEFKKTPSHNLTGMISGGSNPSTAVSSPATKEHHGILQHAPAISQAPPAQPSILRRESQVVSDDQGAMGLGLGAAVGVAGRMDADARQSGLDGLVGRLQKVEEKRERIGWADKVEKTTPVSANLARVPSANSSITGPCRPRLQFAVAHPPSHGSTSASEAGDNSSRRVSAITTHPNDPFAKERKVQESLDEQSSDEVDDDEDEDEDDDEEAGNTPLEDVPRLRGYNSRSTSSSGRRSSELHSPIDEEDDEDDLGYQEDEEDGMFSDEEETTAFDLPGHLSKGKFAFARPTNYFRGRRPSRDDLSPTNSPPPAPSYFPPPNRRGRGHVRVADTVPTLAVDKVERKGCTRHCSPPPSTRSRSGSKVEAAPPAIASPSARFMKRPEAVAGPSKQRMAGSPMPPRMFEDEDEEEDEEEEYEERGNEEEEDDKETPPVVKGGWRSDDALFHGPNAQVRLPSQLIRPYDQPRSRNISAPANQSVFEEDSADDHSVSFSMAREASIEGTIGNGGKNWVRRESELPIYRRPSTSTAPETLFDHPKVRSREVSFSATIPSSSTVPPALDSTPVVGSSYTMDMMEGAGASARLEQALSTSPGPPNSRTPSASARLAVPPSTVSNPSSRSTSSSRPQVDPLNRAVSLSSRVTFQPADKPVRNIAPHRAVSHSGHHLKSQQQVPLPIRCPKRAQGQKEDLGWSDEALMSIRRKAGKETGI